MIWFFQRKAHSSNCTIYESVCGRSDEPNGSTRLTMTYGLQARARLASPNLSCYSPESHSDTRALSCSAHSANSEFQSLKHPSVNFKVLLGDFTLKLSFVPNLFVLIIIKLNISLI